MLSLPNSFRNMESIIIWVRHVTLLEETTNVYMKSSMFWDITSCISLKVNQRFGGTCRLHLQDQSIRQARNQREISVKSGGKQSNSI
jgi:hypothetical protein